jgi:hypothetical protein
MAYKFKHLKGSKISLNFEVFLKIHSKIKFRYMHLIKFLILISFILYLGRFYLKTKIFLILLLERYLNSF